MKLAPNCTLRIENLLILKRPRVQLRHAKAGLSACGHFPNGFVSSSSSSPLSSSLSMSLCLSHIRLEAMRCGLVAVLEGGLVEAPPKELEHVVVLDAVVSLPVVVDKTLLCLEEVSRFLIPCVRLALHCLPPRNGPTFELFVFLTGALDGLRRVPKVPFVCAANISGAIKAISGKEFGADTTVPRRLFESVFRCRSVPSGNLK